MASLLCLANETILQIIDETRPESIWNFVRCCKRIWDLGAKDLNLYRQDVGRYKAPSFSFWDGQSDIEFDTYRFLSEILHQPRRARYVTSLSVVNRVFAFGQTSSQEMLNVLHDIHRLFFMSDGCPYIKGDEVANWVERMYERDTRAVVCLILTLLPNLETLTIKDYGDQMFAEMILKVSKEIQSPYRTIPGPLPLDRLETITIDDIRSINQKNITLGIYEACMTIPSLRRLTGKYIDSAFDRWPSKDEFPMESIVTEIVFDRSAITANAFSRLLSRTKNIRRITCSFVQLLGIHGDYTALSFKHILGLHTARTLTHLDLDFNGHSFEARGRFIGSLRHLRVLKFLRIQANMFVHRVEPKLSHWLVDLFDFLPASIETLVLLANQETPDPLMVYTLAKLRHKKAEFLPKMKEFMCGNGVVLAPGLKDECIRLGIRFVDV